MATQGIMYTEGNYALVHCKTILVPSSFISTVYIYIYSIVPRRSLVMQPLFYEFKIHYNSLCWYFRYGHISEVWELLKGVLPEFKLPLQDWEKALLDEEKAKKDETGSAVGKTKKETNSSVII